jgi:hypothetical protein
MIDREFWSGRGDKNPISSLAAASKDQSLPHDGCWLFNPIKPADIEGIWRACSAEMPNDSAACKEQY